MFGRLMKYDCKSLFKTCVPLWLALLVVSIVNNFTLRMDTVAYGTNLPTILCMLLYVGLIVAVMVVTLVLIIQRFYQGLLRDEGYLMFTLPVRPWQLIASKALTAMLVTLLSGAAAVLSVLFLSADTGFWKDLIEMFPRLLSELGGDVTVTIVLAVLLIVAEILAAVTHIYASLALGHLAHSHRVGWAVVAYIGINMACTTVLVLLSNLSYHLHWSWSFDLASPTAATDLILLLLLIGALLRLAIFFAATTRILSKRLNLE